MSRQRAKVDSTFFSTINPKSAYWAGFIAADGYIKDDGKTLALELSRKDRIHVFKFKHAIQYKGRVFETKSGKRISRLSLKNELIIHFLLSIYNVGPRKSLTLQPPNLYAMDHVRSYIRGYMDGDGSVYEYKSKIKSKHKRLAVSFNGTESMLLWIKKKLRYYIDDISDNKIVKHASIFKLTFTGEQASRVLEWLYQLSSSFIRLDRKYAKYVWHSLA